MSKKKSILCVFLLATLICTVITIIYFKNEILFYRMMCPMAGCFIGSKCADFGKWLEKGDKTNDK